MNKTFKYKTVNNPLKGTRNFADSNVGDIYRAVFLFYCVMSKGSSFSECRIHSS